jgi:cellobiose phosphorylase
MTSWVPYQAFDSHYLERAGWFQSGGAYGFRDQLQTVMNLLASGNPVHFETARKHLLEVARHQFAKGDVAHWWHPHNNLAQRSTIADNLLWFPIALSRYIKMTGDRSILDMKVPFLEGRDLNAGELDYVAKLKYSRKKVTVAEHAERAIDLVLGQRMGAHGLPLFLKGDWNDGLDRVGHLGKGESGWLAFFLYDVLNKYATVAESQKRGASARRYRAQAEELRGNIEKHLWDEKRGYYIRGFADNGERVDFNDAIVQGWAILSGAAPPDRARRAMKAAVKALYKKDHNMILLFDQLVQD